MRILLIEDDAMIGESLSESLSGEHYAVDWVRDGRAAELALLHDVYDLVLLDLGLPRKQGLDVLRDYRKRDGRAPVLIITARDTTEERVQGLDTGADDYLVKPFSLDELFARIRALLRRASGRASPEIRYGDLLLNPITHQVLLAGKPLELSAREFALLYALFNPAGAVVSREALMDSLYSWGEEVESNTIEVYIHQLRKKLGSDMIRTIRGVGYMLAAPAQGDEAGS